MEHAAILASTLRHDSVRHAVCAIGSSVDNLPTSVPPVTLDPVLAGPTCNF